MVGIRELFNKPTGSEVQVNIAQQAREIIIYSEAALTILVPIAVGLLPPEFAPTMIQIYAIQLIAAGMLAFGYLEPRLNRLREIKSERKTN